MTLHSWIGARVEIIRKILWFFDSRERLLLVGFSGMMIAVAALELLGIGAATTFITVLVTPELAASNPALHWLTLTFPSNRLVISFGIGLIFLFFLKNALLTYIDYLQVRFALKKEVALSTSLLAAYLAQPYEFFLRRNSAELMRNVTGEVSRFISGIVLPILVILSECIVLMFLLVMLAAVDPLVALLTGMLVGGTGLAFVQSVKPVLRQWGRERSASSEGLIRWVNQAIGGAKEVKLLRCEGFFLDAFEENARRFAHAGLVVRVINNLLRPVMETVIVAVLMAVVILSIKRGYELSSLLPLLTLFVLAGQRIMPSVNRIASSANQIRFCLPAVDAILSDLQPGTAAVTVDTKADPIDKPGKLLTREVQADGLGYRYKDAAQWALRHVSLRIPCGTAVGFMGATGAGKSTLIDLLLGLMQPTEGRILVDGRPISELRAGWQRHIGYVPQFIYLLDDSVRRNVALGVPQHAIDDQRVWEVLRQARLEDVVRRLPQGIASSIGERGVRLSGGERQRLGIARALYRNPEVVVFDEATSALDAQTEREIRQVTSALPPDRTLIIISHRTTTVQACDVVFFLRDGRLADQGTFDELVERNEDFRRTVNQEG